MVAGADRPHDGPAEMTNATLAATTATLPATAPIEGVEAGVAGTEGVATEVEVVVGAVLATAIIADQGECRS